ncbi:hypothetical protein PENTCL1PPCAC_8036, partial [Pristionchus entomophagus]
SIDNPSRLVEHVTSAKHVNTIQAEKYVINESAINFWMNADKRATVIPSLIVRPSSSMKEEVSRTIEEVKGSENCGRQNEKAISQVSGNESIMDVLEKEDKTD